MPVDASWVVETWGSGGTCRRCTCCWSCATPCATGGSASRPLGWKGEKMMMTLQMMMMSSGPPHILLHSRSSWWPPCKPEVFLSGSFSFSSISTMFYLRASMEVQFNQLIVNLWKLMISNSDCSTPTWRKPCRSSMWARHSDNVPSEEPGEENHSAWLSRYWHHVIMFTYCLVIIAQNVVVSVQNSNATICVELNFASCNEYKMMLFSYS